MALNQTQVSQLYVALFGRASEGEGNTFWQAEADQATAANAMLATSAASTYFGTSLNSNQAFVEHIYLNTLGKTLAQDPDGIAFWVKALTDGNSRGFVVAELIKSATDAATAGTAQDQFLNRVEVSNYMATTVQTAPADYATSTAFKSAAKPTGALDVTSVAATVTTAKAAIVTLSGGQTFTLTNSATADTVIGTSGSDVINGASGTVVAGDLMIDSSTTDNDTANLVVTAAYTPSNITKIENINLDWDSYGTATYALTGVTGAKNITLTSSKTGFLGNATVTGVNGVTLTAGTGMTGTITASGFKTGVVNASNAATIVVNGSTTNANNASISVVAGDNATSVTVGTTNGFKASTINAGKAATIAIADAGNTTDTMALTVNANATITNTGTGALTLTASNGNNITMNAIGASLAVAGEGDVILNSTGLTTETVTNSKTAGTLTIKSSTVGGEDVSKVSANLIQFTGIKIGADTVANGANLKYTNGGVIGVTVTGTSTNDAVTAELTAATATSVTTTGVEVLTIKSAANLISGADLTIASLETNGNTVKFTGTNDVAVTNIAVTGETGGKIDASGLTGELTVGINTIADDDNFTIIGGSAKVTVTTANVSGAQSVEGTVGDDTVTADATTTGSMTAILAAGKNTVSATGLTTGALVVTAGDGIDTVTSGAALTTGVINLNLGNGNNIISLADAAGAGTRDVTTGGGDDTLTFTGASLDDANDVLKWTAGTGTDTLVLATEGADLSASKVTLTDVEVIKVKAESFAEASHASYEAKFAASQLSGKTVTVKADAYDATKPTDVLVKGIASTTTIDLSTVTFDQSITGPISAVAITALAASTSAVTITGSSIADRITGSDKDDSITAGNGADTIVGSKGNDTINITETTANSSVDVITFLAADNGVDTITGFKVGTDDLSFDAAFTTVTTVAGAAATDTFSAALLATAGTYTIGTGGAGTLVTTTTDVVELGVTLSSYGDLDLAIDGTELLKALGSTATSAATSLTAAASGDKFVLVAYQDSKAYAYLVATGADAVASASEISLVGVVNDVVAGSIVATDFLVY